MPTLSSEVVLHVDPATARAYRDASAQEKEQARAAFERALATRREATRKAAAKELIHVMNEMAREAKERGLTPEILERILREEPPSDEPASGGEAANGEGAAR